MNNGHIYGHLLCYAAALLIAYFSILSLCCDRVGAADAGMLKQQPEYDLVLPEDMAETFVMASTIAGENQHDVVMGACEHNISNSKNQD